MTFTDLGWAMAMAMAMAMVMATVMAMVIIMARRRMVEGTILIECYEF
jgi:hypothetical protein